MHIKFENGSEIHSITAKGVKRGKRAVLRMYDDMCRLKWYQKILMRIYSWWIYVIDTKIRHWKYKDWR